MSMTKKIADWSTVARVYFPIEVLQSADSRIVRKSDIVNSRNDFFRNGEEVDKGVEQIQANGGMDSAAMEADYEAEQNPRPDYLDEQGYPHWFDEEGETAEIENPFLNADPEQVQELYEQAEAVDKMQQEAAAKVEFDRNGNPHYPKNEADAVSASSESAGSSPGQSAHEDKIEKSAMETQAVGYQPQKEIDDYNESVFVKDFCSGKFDDIVNDIGDVNYKSLVGEMTEEESDKKYIDFWNRMFPNGEPKNVKELRVQWGEMLIKKEKTAESFYEKWEEQAKEADTEKLLETYKRMKIRTAEMIPEENEKRFKRMVLNTISKENEWSKIIRNTAYHTLAAPLDHFGFYLEPLSREVVMRKEIIMNELKSRGIELEIEREQKTKGSGGILLEIPLSEIRESYEVSTVKEPLEIVKAIAGEKEKSEVLDLFKHEFKEMMRSSPQKDPFIVTRSIINKWKESKSEYIPVLDEWLKKQGCTSKEGFDAFFRTINEPGHKKTRHKEISRQHER